VALRPLLARKILKALSKLGFRLVRQKGSHLILKHPDGRLTVIPMHAREEIGRGLLRKIAFDAKLSPSQLIKLIEQDP
jgi:predicted RNA binding protein YcfA (HicA-like mRNA interferase family)